MTTWKVAGLAAALLTLLWLLSPERSRVPVAPGVVEITFMGSTGGDSDTTYDALRAFEAQSREEHAKDPSRPVYHVVSGQNASRNQTEDPTRFLVSVAGGMPPDVIRFDRFAVTEWAARNAFEPLDKYLAADLSQKRPDAIHAADYYPSCWGEVTYHDPVSGRSGVYGIPESLDSRAFLYNKDLLKRAGFVDANGEATPPRTWEDLEKMAAKLTEYDAQGRITRLGFAPNVGNAWLYIYGWMNGGEMMSADRKQCTLNDPRNVAALEWMAHMYDEVGGAQNVNAFQTSLQGGDLDPFLLGKVAMKIDGFWQVSLLAQFGQDLNYGVVPPPMPAAELAKGRKPLSWMGGWCFSIPSTSRHKQGAWELVRFLSGRKAAEIMAESRRLTMESQGRAFIPGQVSNRGINDWLFQKYVYDNPRMDPKLADACRVYNGLIDGARFRPVTPVGQFMWNESRTATDNAVFKKLTPQQALDRATADVQRELDRVLSPPKGRPLSWTAFFAAYLAIMLGTAATVYRWDTNDRFRKRILALLAKIGVRDIKAGEHLDGMHSGYFRSQWKGGLFCAAPWIIGFLAFTGGPLLFSIVISFCEYDILNPPRMTGLDNYRWMFTQDTLFWKSMGNTLYMLIGIPLGMGLSLGMALLLNLKIRGIAVWRTFFYLPSIMPAVASSILWIWIFNPNAGLLNSVLASFGIHGPNWLQDEHTSKISLIIMGLWGAGGGMIIWLAGLKGISESYYEAAELDGAGIGQKFFHVTLPMLSPYIYFNLIMGLIGTFQIFTQAFIMTEGGPVNSTLFYAYHLFNNAFRYLHMGYACAMGWVLFLIVFGLTVLQTQLSKRWVHYEGD